jgi:hypothetical protein
LGVDAPVDESSRRKKGRAIDDPTLGDGISQKDHPARRLALAQQSQIVIFETRQ